MFAKNNAPEADYKDVETIIGSSVKVEGNFVCDGSMVIDGQVKGLVRTNQSLTVGTKAIITADVSAGNARIAGEINGNLKVDGFLELAETARINGDIEIGSLAVTKGAIINGNIKMGADISVAKDIVTE